MIIRIFTLLLLLNACSNEEKMLPIPVAKKIPHVTEINGVKLEDDYAWMRDPKWPVGVTDPKILDYLKEENKYSAHFFDKNAALAEKIFEELKGRIKLTDQSTYVKKDDYYYYTRIEEKSNYRIYCRKHKSIEAKEQVMLDVNKLAEGQNFISIGAAAISPDHKLFVYSLDSSGHERHKIRVLNLETGEYLPDEIVSTGGNIVWHRSVAGFFYTPLGDDMRHDKVMFHKLGTPSSQDKELMRETNPLYQLGFGSSSSLQYLMINIAGYDSNELRFIDLYDNNFEIKTVVARRDGVKYKAEHNGDFFYILTNECGSNFCMKRMKTHALGAQNLMEYIPEDKDRYLESFDITKNYLILNYRSSGLAEIIVRDIGASNKENKVSFPDAAFAASGNSTNFAEDDIRINYSSLGRPSTTYSYNFTTEKLSVLKAQEIPSGFNPDEYAVERIFAETDGVRVPISVFYKKSLFKKDGSNPLYLYGYGSYSISIPASFRSTAVTLADRGFVYAIAHIRGGDELGYGWYEAAKFLTKKRTFNDFIAVAEHMIKEGYTSSGNIVISGGSAGGMLVGAVINERPELYKAAIALVPFVDVLNTMLDETLPLTPGEFKEWGNPKDPEYFKYIRSYSPYDNVKAQNYPTLFVTAGISDPRVGYWEPAKWVAKLRSMKMGNNMLLFKVNMDAGHQGASGRFDEIKEAVDEYVFIFKTWGLD
jgi:oligopeptidase B